MGVTEAQRPTQDQLLAGWDEKSQQHLKRKFRHARFFEGWGITRAEALDRLAEMGADFVIRQKHLKAGTVNQLVYAGKEGGRYTFSGPEKAYYHSRRAYWQRQQRK